MDLHEWQEQALRVLQWEQIKAPVRWFSPSLELLWDDPLDPEHFQLIQRICAHLPFAVSAVERVEHPKQFLALDFRSKTASSDSEVKCLYRIPIDELFQSPDEKKKLWHRLQEFSDRGLLGSLSGED